MAIDSVNAGSAAGAQLFGGASQKDALGQEAFLELMVAQLRNQDPLKPMDPSTFLGQLAQFGTVSGIQNMQGSLSALSDALRGSQVLNGTSLVGHDVLAAADQVSLGETGEVQGRVSIPANATEAVLIVTDGSGQLVRRMPLSVQQGDIGFTWDGLDDRGERAAPGNYEISAIANVGGAAEQLETQLVGRVASVTIDSRNQTLTLNTDLGPISLSRVRSVM